MVSLVNFRSVGELTTVSGAIESSPNGQSEKCLPSAEHPPRAHEIFSDNNNSAQNPKKYNISNRIGSFEPEFQLQQHKNQPLAGKEAHFEIRWNNLTYSVEPKWYSQKWAALTGSDRKQSSATSRLSSDPDSKPPDYTSSVSNFQQKSQDQSGKHHISINASSSSKDKTIILNDLNGSVRSGQVTAILGPSGAGKTSLLGCLTGKKKSGVSGSVQILSARNKPMSICTIPQKDYLLNQLTVRENLWFASRLKHPENNFDHDANIERVLDLLKLGTCIDTKISKISGGQYKRVSIAQELLSNPDILILDEPTSGLDSLTCYKTVMVLRDLARLSPNPMAIIVTIHQPQREVFDLFNHVYILATGGRCIYEGHPSQSIATINKSGGGLSFDVNQYNPASYLVEIASAEFGQKPIEALVKHQREEFKRRILIQDQAHHQQEFGAGFNNNGMHQIQLNTQYIYPAGTPNLKKRQSPMIARFKSTLTGLAGSPRSGAKNRQGQQQFAAFSNEAYDTSQFNLNQLDHGETQQNQIIVNNNNNNQPQQTATATKDNGLIVPSSHYSIVDANGAQQLLEGDEFYLDDRLQTHKHNHKGHFFRHCSLLTKRSWLCLCKDPMLTTLRFSAHIIVPLLITLVYGNRVGKPNACPLYETEMDLIEYARHGAKRLLNLQDELRCTFENVGLYFLSVYAFTFSTMCLTSLSFPLNMHVLLKEVRNGWYSIPTYFIGKTLADFPLEFILPTVTLMITYPLTGQPSSYLEWRFILATLIFVVTSLIAQTQGLIFGALFMNAMQAAVFVAPVSTTPLILLSGFLIRVSQMPAYLQKLSNLSYFRYAIESLTIIRYGFGQCPCDPQLVTGKAVTASGVPDQLRTMTNYWLSTFDSSNSNDALNETISELITTTTADPSIITTTEAPIDFFQDLTVLLARANSFGADIKTCEDLKPYPMIDFNLKENQLWVWCAALVGTLFFSKVVNYLVVKYSVKFRL